MRPRVRVSPLRPDNGLEVMLLLLMEIRQAYDEVLYAYKIFLLASAFCVPGICDHGACQLFLCQRNRPGADA